MVLENCRRYFLSFPVTSEPMNAGSSSPEPLTSSFTVVTSLADIVPWLIAELDWPAALLESWLVSDCGAATAVFCCVLRWLVLPVEPGFSFFLLLSVYVEMSFFIVVASWGLLSCSAAPSHCWCGWSLFLQTVGIHLFHYSQHSGNHFITMGLIDLWRNSTWTCFRFECLQLLNKENN